MMSVFLDAAFSFGDMGEGFYIAGLGMLCMNCVYEVSGVGWFSAVFFHLPVCLHIFRRAEYSGQDPVFHDLTWWLGVKPI